MRYLLVPVLLLAFSLVTFAQNEPIRPDWLRKDIEQTELISGLLIPDYPTKEFLDATFTNNGLPDLFSDSSDVGFGARKYHTGFGGGYTSLFVDAFIFENSTVFSTISIQSSSNQWQGIKPKIIAAIQANTDLTFKEAEDGLFFYKQNDAALAAYKNAVSKALGPQQDVTVPLGLNREYELLISPFNNSTVGSGGCGYGGETPRGKEAIDALVKANRTDLVENVLRGFNPGGRVYAAIALLEAKQKGNKLSSQTEAALGKVMKLDVKIETCRGCIYSYLTAEKLLREYKLL